MLGSHQQQQLNEAKKKKIYYHQTETKEYEQIRAMSPIPTLFVFRE